MRGSIQQQAPSRGHRRYQRSRRAMRTAIILLVVFLLAGASYTSLQFSWNLTTAVPAPRPTADTLSAGSSPFVRRFKALPEARSVQGIQAVCATQASELESAPWMHHLPELRAAGGLSANQTHQELLNVRGKRPGNRAAYRVVPHPVCVDRTTGLFYIANADRDLYLRVPPESSPLYPAHAHPTAWAALDDVLPLTDTQASSVPGALTVKVVPALGVMGFGRFITTHMWHLLKDSMEALIWAFNTYADGAIWRLPRQAVLLDMEGSRWLDRDGDTPQKMAISAAMFNMFSSFPGDSTEDGHNVDTARLRPLLPKAMILRIAVDAARSRFRAPRTSLSFLQLLHLRSASPTSTDLVCFCQAMMAHNAVVPKHTSTRPHDELVQDRVAVQFGAPPYRSLETESVWDIERQRTEHYPPWAQQFWQPTSTTSTTSATVYQPRVLFIHRAKRTIANVGVYVKAMRDLGFRVEEAYLERLSTEQQYYLGRYADVVVGMHGLGIGHALWMNRLPTGCRTVIEFRLWSARHAPVRLQNTLGGQLQYRYLPIWPVDVAFGPSVASPMAERQLLIARGHNAFRLPGWNDQEAFFDDEEVMQTLRNVQTHLQECLKTTPASPTASHRTLL